MASDCHLECNTSIVHQLTILAMEILVSATLLLASAFAEAALHSPLACELQLRHSVGHVIVNFHRCRETRC